MMSSAACKVCQVGGMRMHSIENIRLLGIYEKLTSTKLSTEEIMSLTLCYICYSLLQKCCRFSDMVHRSEKMLRNEWNTGNKHITQNLHPCPVLNLVRVKNLSVTIAETLQKQDYMASPLTHGPNESQPTEGDICHNNYFCLYEDTPTAIKTEINVKHEPSSDDEEVFVKTEKCTFETDTCFPEKVEDQNIIENGRLCSKMQLSCDVCNKMFRSRHHLQIHSRTHTEKNQSKPFYCNKCHKSFSRFHNFRKHIKICTGSPTMTCSLCTKIFTDINSFEKHMKIHSQEKRFICDICSKRFNTTTKLRFHLKTHIDEKLFKCEVCEKSFKQQAHLRLHKIVHNNDRPFECDICGKKYPIKGTLKYHMRSHTGERPFLCNTCGMSFGFKCSLNVHIKRLHTEVKKYACNKCNLSFNHEVGLMGHIRSHTAERSHPCNICGKMFTSAHNLKGHMNVHSDERPYVCNRCGKAYKRPKHLKQHKKTIKCNAVAISRMSFDNTKTKPARRISTTDQ